MCIVFFVGNTFFLCKYCNKNYSCKEDGITAVRRHNFTQKHEKNAQIVASNKQIYQNTKGNHVQRAKIIELQLAMLLVEHNIPISFSDALVEFIKGLDIDSKVQSLLSCDRTKCSALIKNVIGRVAFEELVLNLREKKFSIIIDESTDIGTEKHLVIVVRYLGDDGKVRDEFLALLKVRIDN